MHRAVGDDIDLEPLWHERVHELGMGRYERLLVVDELDDLPVVTFTCPAGHRPPLNAPSTAYLDTIARGLRETHHLDDEAITHYLDSLQA